MNMDAKKFYDEQIQFLVNHDVNGLIDQHYCADADLISLVQDPLVISGASALKEFFTSYLEALGDLEVISTDKFVSTDDSIFFEATVKSNLGVVKVFDAFVMKEDKIFRHFSGLLG